MFEKEPLGVYVHVPFCNERCDYCSFCSTDSFRNDETFLAAYLDSLCSEIEKSLPKEGRLLCNTIYIGGGTPTTLSNNDIARIIEAISRRFDLTAGAELTIETNPGHFDLERFKDLLLLGINRVSLGVQTLDFSVYEDIGRKGGFVTEKILHDFFSLPCRTSIDLIAGTDTKRSTVEELRKILQFKPEHLSIYLLSVDEGTPLGLRKSIDSKLEQKQVSEYRQIATLLERYKYEHYEISSWCKPGSYSRHNTRYWDFSPYIGFGPGAHSFFDGRRYSNSCNIKEYVSAEYQRNEEKNLITDRIVEYFDVRLRTMWGVFEEDYKALFETDFPEEIVIKAEKLDSVFTASGRKGERRIVLPQYKWLQADSYIYELVEDLL